MLKVEQGNAGLWYVTSDVVPGLLVTGDTQELALASVGQALADMQAAMDATGFRASAPAAPVDGMSVREALRGCTCPRPMNTEPDDLTVGACIDKGQCGCLAGAALAPAAAMTDDEAMRRLSASEVACYRWPEATMEHDALRAAYVDGAASTTSNAEPVAWQWLTHDTWHTIDKTQVTYPEAYARGFGHPVRPIYTTPPSAGNADAVREQIARIIDPYAWSDPDNMTPTERVLFENQSAHRRDTSYWKADTIAALSSAPVAADLSGSHICSRCGGSDDGHHWSCPRPDVGSAPVAGARHGGLTEDRIQELYEIADGALSDGPMVRGNAIKMLRDAGLDYPDTRNDRLPPATEGV